MLPKIRFKMPDFAFRMHSCALSYCAIGEVYQNGWCSVKHSAVSFSLYSHFVLRSVIVYTSLLVWVMAWHWTDILCKLKVWFVSYLCHFSPAVLKIKTVYHARDLWKLAQSCKLIAFNMPIRPTNFTRYCLTQCIPKLLLRSFGIHWVRL